MRYHPLLRLQTSESQVVKLMADMHVNLSSNKRDGVVEDEAQHLKNLMIRGILDRRRLSTWEQKQKKKELTQMTHLTYADMMYIAQFIVVVDETDGSAPTKSKRGGFSSIAEAVVSTCEKCATAKKRKNKKKQKGTEPPPETKKSRSRQRIMSQLKDRSTEDHMRLTLSEEDYINALRKTNYSLYTFVIDMIAVHDKKGGDKSVRAVLNVRQKARELARFLKCLGNEHVGKLRDVYENASKQEAKEDDKKQE